MCVCYTTNFRELSLSRTKSPRLRVWYEFMPKALHKKNSIFAAKAAETVSPPRGGRCTRSAIEVVFASRSMAHLIKRACLRFFSNVPCIPCAAKWPLGLLQPFARRVLGSMLRCCTASTPVSSSFEGHHFVDRSALFTSGFRRDHGIGSAKQKRSAAELKLPEAYFTWEPFGPPLIL